MADSGIGNYSPDDFTIILSKGDFVHRISGFADGTFISMDRIIPTSTPYQGVGSNPYVRTKRKRTAMDVAITLHQASPSNLVLQYLQNADAATSGNEWVFNCTMRDISGQTVLSTNTAIIQAPANASFSSQVETREWHIYMFGSDTIIGGNMLLDSADVAAVNAVGGTVDPRWQLANQ